MALPSVLVSYFIQINSPEILQYFLSFFCDNKIKIISRKFIISSSIINQIVLMSSGEIENIIQEGEIISGKTPQ